jgi:hypothetical protein
MSCLYHHACACRYPKQVRAAGSSPAEVLSGERFEYIQARQQALDPGIGSGLVRNTNSSFERLFRQEKFGYGAKL